PNYGSHIAALFPECAAAARLLLDAIVAVYDGFFALSWAEHPVYGRTVSANIGSLETWSCTIQRLQSQTLPEVRRTAAEAPVVAKVMQAPALIDWLTTKRDDLVEMLRDTSAGPLLDQLPRRTGVVEDEVSSYLMWDGARAIDIL